VCVCVCVYFGVTKRLIYFRFTNQPTLLLAVRFRFHLNQEIGRSRARRRMQVSEMLVKLHGE